mmetsp:Transcript_157098/g.285990  ORF Transcript_157098/g.285990 Transcript_157098/m.285990 type:complete len:1640 (+) Transcript_157098:165-5084(+)
MSAGGSEAAAAEAAASAAPAAEPAPEAKPKRRLKSKREGDDAKDEAGSKPSSARSATSKPPSARSNKSERSEEGKKRAKEKAPKTDEDPGGKASKSAEKEETADGEKAAEAEAVKEAAAEDKAGEEKGDADKKKKKEKKADGEEKKDKKKKDKEGKKSKDSPKDNEERKESPKDNEEKKESSEVSKFNAGASRSLDYNENEETPRDAKETPREDQESSKEAPETQPEPPAKPAGAASMSPARPVGRSRSPQHKARNYVPDEAALKSEIGALARQCELDDALIELVIKDLGLNTIGCIANMDALREFTLQVLDAEYTPPGECEPRELNGNEVKKLKLLYEKCREEGGMAPGPFCNRMQRFYDNSVKDFRECLDSFDIPQALQTKLFEDGVDNKARLANVPGATFRTVILGLRFVDKDGEEPRALTKGEQSNMKNCWEACRQEQGMPIQRGSETRPSVIRQMIKEKVLTHEFGESLEKCGRTFKQIAESFDVCPKLLEVLMTAGFDGKSKLARLQVPGEFKVQVLSLKYDHGDGTRTPLTIEDKEKLIHLLNECRKEAGFPEFHGMTPPHSPAPNKMRTLPFCPEKLKHTPPSHIPVTQKWLDLAKIAEENGIAPHVLRGLAYLGYDTTGKVATIMVPMELNIAVLKAHFNDGNDNFITFTEDEKKQVVKLHEVCRQNAKIPNHDTDDDHCSAMTFVKTDKVGVGQHLPTHITGAWEHSIAELMIPCGIPEKLQQMLLSYGFNTPIECAPENFKVQMTRFQYDPEGNGRYRYLTQDEKDQLCELHDACRAELGWPLHTRRDPDAELQVVIARKLDEPLPPKDDPQVFEQLAEECEVGPDLFDAILALGLNTATKVAKIQVPGEFNVHVLSLVYKPALEKVTRKLTDDEKQLVKFLCGKCRMLVGLPTRRDFLPAESLCVLEHMEQCNLPDKLKVALQQEGVTNMAAAESFHQMGKIDTFKYDPGDGSGERFLNEREKKQMETFCVHVEHDYHPLDDSGRKIDEAEERHLHGIAIHCEIPDELLEAIYSIGLHTVHDVARLSFPEFRMMLMQIFYHPKGEKGRRRVNKEEKHNLRMFYAECREDFGLPCRRGYLPLLEGSGACWRPFPEILSATGLDGELEVALMHEGCVDTKSAAEFSEDSDKFREFLDSFKYDPTNGAHPGEGCRPITAEERKQLESAFEMCRLEAVYHQDPRKGIEERAAKMEAKTRSIEHISTHVGINRELQDAIENNGLRIHDIGKMLPAEFRVHMLGIKYRPQGEQFLRPLNADEKKQLTDFYSECRKDKGMPARRESNYITPRVIVEMAPPGARGLQMRTLDELALEHGVPRAILVELQKLNLSSTREYGQLRQPKQLEAVVHGLKYAPKEGAEKRALRETEILQLKWMYEDCRRELLMPSGLYNEAHLLDEVPSPMSPKKAWGDTWGDLSTTAGSGAFGSPTTDEDRDPRFRSQQQKFRHHHHSGHHHRDEMTKTRSRRERDVQDSHDNDTINDIEGDEEKRSHQSRRHHHSHRHPDTDEPGMGKTSSMRKTKSHKNKEGSKRSPRQRDTGDHPEKARLSTVPRQSIAQMQAAPSSKLRARESNVGKRTSMAGGPPQSTRTSTFSKAGIGSRLSRNPTIPANIQARLSQRLSKVASLIENSGDR